MKLYLKPMNEYVKSLYTNHGHYNQGDSGLDLFIPETVIVNPGETIIIDLMIRCEAKTDDNSKNISYYTYPRSSISKTPLRLANSVGIIDAGYRGNLFGIFDNIKTYQYEIKAGTRLLQICSPNLDEIKLYLVDELSNTERGENGIGSTN